MNLKWASRVIVIALNMIIIKFEAIVVCVNCIWNCSVIKLRASRPIGLRLFKIPNSTFCTFFSLLNRVIMEFWGTYSNDLVHRKKKKQMSVWKYRMRISFRSNHKLYTCTYKIQYNTYIYSSYSDNVFLCYSFKYAYDGIGYKIISSPLTTFEILMTFKLFIGTSIRSRLYFVYFSTSRPYFRCVRMQHIQIAAIFANI